MPESPPQGAPPLGKGAPRSYQAFHHYYTLRTRVLGLQSALGTVVYRTVEYELGAARRILDVGCGRGMYLVPLAAAGRRVVGLDAAESNVALLSAHGCAAHTCDCVQEIPSQFGGNDAIICAEFLEHLSPTEAASLLRNIHRALKDEGVLVVTVPYREDLTKGLVVCPRCGEVFHMHGHLRTFETPEELVEQVEQAGFRRLRQHVVSPTKRMKKLGIYRLLPFSLYLEHNRRKGLTRGRLIASFVRSSAPA